MTNTFIDMTDVGRVDRTQTLMMQARRMRAEAAGEMIRAIGRAGRQLMKSIKTYYDDLRLIREMSRLDDRSLADKGLNRATLRYDLRHGRSEVTDIYGTVVTSRSARAETADPPTPANATSDRQAA